MNLLATKFGLFVILTIALSISLGYTSNAGDRKYSKYFAPMYFAENRNFAYHDSVAEDGSNIFEIYQVGDRQRPEFTSTVLLTGRGLWFPQLCDSNTAVFVDTSCGIIHLLIAKLTSKVKIDTLFSLPGNAKEDWLAQTLRFEFSLKDSLFAFRTVLDSAPAVFMYKIESDRDYTLHKIERGAHSVMNSWDFSQLLMERQMHSAYFGIRGRTEIIIYDHVAGQSIVLHADDVTFKEPKRRSRNEPIYYLREYDGRVELWQYMEEKGEKPVYQPTLPERVRAFYFLPYPDISFAVDLETDEPGSNRSVIVEQ